ncbi:hypothetical protein GGS20DRAFT_511104 [Poronia punctata]|nr:hypothetical protein GGS20DRAFT_511104 [Poronia punctata]
MASFRTDFSNVTRNTDLLLQWDISNVTEYPVKLQVLIVNKTSEHEANVIEVVIATGLTNNSYLWREIPLPLPFLPTAEYELRVRPQEGRGPILASSPLFEIAPAGGSESNTTGAPKSPSASHTGGHHDSSAAIAAGVVVPLVVLIAVVVFLYMQRRQTRIAEARQKAREGLVIN